MSETKLKFPTNLFSTSTDWESVVRIGDSHRESEAMAALDSNDFRASRIWSFMMSEPYPPFDSTLTCSICMNEFLVPARFWMALHHSGALLIEALLNLFKSDSHPKCEPLSSRNKAVLPFN